MVDLLYKNEVYKIIGCAMEVHRELGNGFLEAVYQEALALEFKEKLIPFHKEKKLSIFYKKQKLTKYYLADFICFDDIIIEIKALSSLTSDHESQILNYLKATHLRVGLLVNFGTSSLQYKRFIL